MKRLRILCCFVLLGLCLSPAAAARAASEADGAANAPAEDLSQQCIYTLPSRKKYVSDLRSIRRSTAILNFTGETTVTLAWGPDVPVRQVYLEWYERPASYRVIQRDESGAVLSDVPGDCVPLGLLLPLEPGAASLSLYAEEGYHLYHLLAFGEGALPDWYLPWAPTLEKLDYLIVSAHPDDDQLFMGAVIPTYTGGQGLQGTVLYMTCRTRERYTEALNGLWETGLRNLPLFAFYRDGTPQKSTMWTFWDYDAVVQYLVRQLRALRPEVVVTHDQDGEYGQPLHVVTSAAVREAVSLCGDPAYDPESAATDGVWTVKKLYLHLYGEARLTIDMRTPLPAYGGRTALEVATAAYEQHKSQQYLWFRVDDRSAYSPAEYGLYASTVGADTAHDSMFENIPPACLSTFAGDESDAAAGVSADSEP